MDFLSFQKTHALAMTQINGRLGESKQHLYTLEAIVGEAPEEAPHSLLCNPVWTTWPPASPLLANSSP